MFWKKNEKRVADDVALEEGEVDISIPNILSNLIRLTKFIKLSLKSSCKILMSRLRNLKNLGNFVWKSFPETQKQKSLLEDDDKTDKRK